MTTRIVTIPACIEHGGYPGNAINVQVEWVCPECGGPRGETYETLSFDGSRRLGVDGWSNPCGHIDLYSELRAEAAANGLNEKTAAAEIIAAAFAG